MSEPYYITTAIAYPNGRPHIGHAYEAIAADAIARFQRLTGRDVRFLTGTDEHGLKMVQTAREAGAKRWNSPTKCPAISVRCARNSIFHMTVSCGRPTRAIMTPASRFWKAMEANGDLYLDRYEGWYSVRDEAYYGDEGTDRRGRGQKLSPQGTPVEWTVEESWFFRLSKYQEPLLDALCDNPDFIRPESRRNEVVRFVEGGLQGSQRFADQLRLGRAGAGIAGPCHVCLGRCADDLSDRDWLS